MLLTSVFQISEFAALTICTECREQALRFLREVVDGYWSQGRTVPLGFETQCMHPQSVGNNLTWEQLSRKMRESAQEETLSLIADEMAFGSAFQVDGKSFELIEVDQATRSYQVRANFRFHIPPQVSIAFADLSDAEKDAWDPEWRAKQQNGGSL